jgi:hypothetical protein
MPDQSALDNGREKLPITHTYFLDHVHNRGSCGTRIGTHMVSRSIRIKNRYSLLKKGYNGRASPHAQASLRWTNIMSPDALPPCSWSVRTGFGLVWLPMYPNGSNRTQFTLFSLMNFATPSGIILIAVLKSQP